MCLLATCVLPSKQAGIVLICYSDCSEPQRLSYVQVVEKQQKISCDINAAPLIFCRAAAQAADHPA